jgi:glycosyltransferase involved in cell wall biosynthesis
MERAHAIITSSSDVSARIRRQFKSVNLPDIPILVEPLPSPLEFAAHLDLSAPHFAPYFITIGTIEPRKNHSFLFNIWRSLKLADFDSKLLLVGKRGWENEQIIRELELTPELQGRIVEISNLPPAHLKWFITNALALLMPSFAEGYGLPLVEALSEGVPVVCSDISVFREVSQGKARFRSPLDGLGWIEDIKLIAMPQSQLRVGLVESAKAFRPPTWVEYFKRVEEFLSQI